MEDSISYLDDLLANHIDPNTSLRERQQNGVSFTSQLERELTALSERLPKTAPNRQQRKATGI